MGCRCRGLRYPQLIGRGHPVSGVSEGEGEGQVGASDLPVGRVGPVAGGVDARQLEGICCRICDRVDVVVQLRHAADADEIYLLPIREAMRVAGDDGGIGLRNPGNYSAV